MPDPHSQLLAMIERHWPEHRPPVATQSDELLCEVGMPEKIWVRQIATEAVAWRIVREWCSNKEGNALVIDQFGEQPRHMICFQPWMGPGTRRLGSGPTDADALLAALAAIVKEKEC